GLRQYTSLRAIICVARTVLLSTTTFDHFECFEIILQTTEPREHGMEFSVRRPVCRASRGHASHGRVPMGVHLMGMHLTGVYLTGLHLMSVYLMGMQLTAVYLMGMYLIGMY